MNEIKYSLYLVTDSGLAGSRTIEDIVFAAIQGGVDVVQYREKNGTTRRMMEEASKVLKICRANHVPLIVNDRVDVALAIDADGVHVGQDDMLAGDVRRLIGPQKILGVSVGNLAEMEQAVKDGADYVGASPIYATPTKPEADKPMGLEGLKKMAEICPLPIVAIGGINQTNLIDIIHAGAAGAAVISAIVTAEDIRLAAQRLKQEIKKAL